MGFGPRLTYTQEQTIEWSEFEPYFLDFLKEPKNGYWLRHAKVCILLLGRLYEQNRKPFILRYLDQITNTFFEVREWANDEESLRFLIKNLPELGSGEKLVGWTKANTWLENLEKAKGRKL